MLRRVRVGLLASCMAVCDADKDQHSQRTSQLAERQTLAAKAQAAPATEGEVMEGRATSIAFLARRYRLLSERPEYLTDDRAEVIERLLAAQVTVSELDRTLILHASALDLFCAYAVRSLMSRAPVAVLDILGALGGDRVVAMFYALPERRRAVVRRDPVWGYYIAHAPKDLSDTIAEVEACAEHSQRTSCALARLAATAPGEARKAEIMERVALRTEVGLLP